MQVSLSLKLHIDISKLVKVSDLAMYSHLKLISADSETTVTNCQY